MKVSVEIMNGWEWAKRAALRTIGKKPKKGAELPSREWKQQALIAEHSPIKLVEYWIDMDDLKQWIGVHYLRHPFVLPFISSQRSDRTANPEDAANAVLSMIREDIINDPNFNRENWRDYRLQGSSNDHTFVVNAQTLINISRKRLCGCASKETRQAWSLVKDAIAEIDPETAKAMVPNCIYRGFCPEMTCCGYCLSKSYQKELVEYRNLIPQAEDRIKK